ncbi:hypothetical protein C8R43DRAFT_1021091 [Mycena crocata]|nr:hypothetical protein C8R43DRAFT_1021091 [Mycena crocata]
MSQTSQSHSRTSRRRRQHIQPLKSSGVRLGSPAISSGPGGLPWLTSFLQACSGCTIDFVVVH